ncbi:unnamed protein product [Urochloa humidicola]
MSSPALSHPGATTATHAAAHPTLVADETPAPPSPSPTGTPPPTPRSLTAQPSSPAPTPKTTAHQSPEGIPSPALTHLTPAGIPSPAPTHLTPEDTPAPASTSPICRLAAASPSLFKVSTPDLASATTSRPQAASPTLSPAAPPFYPASAGRSKEARWLDGSDDDECVDYGFTPSPSPRPSTYRDAVCRGSPVLSPQAAAAPATAVATVPAASGGTADPVAPPARRRRRRPSRRARNRRAPPLRVAYPPRPPRVEERGPTRERLPPRAPAATPDSCRLPRVDADGFEEVLSRSNRRRLRRAEAASNRPSAPSSMRIPLEMRDRCLNCLSHNHRVATCRLPRRCLRCHKFRHLARDCRQPRSTTLQKVAGGARRAPPRRPHVTRIVTPTPRVSQAPSRCTSSAPTDALAFPTGTSTALRGHPVLHAEPECCHDERREAMAREALRKAAAAAMAAAAIATAVLVHGLMGSNSNGGAGARADGSHHELCRPVDAVHSSKVDSNKRKQTKRASGPTQPLVVEGHHIPAASAFPAAPLPSTRTECAEAVCFELQRSCVDWSPPHRALDPMLLELRSRTPVKTVYSGHMPVGEVEVGEPAATAATVTCPAEHGLIAAQVASKLATDWNEAVDLEEPELGSPPGFPRTRIPDEETPESRLSAFTKVDVAATPVPLVEPASVEVTATVVASEVDRSVALEAFINNVTKDISPPLLTDKPPRRRRVDPVLVDAPPQLPSSEASGIRRSHRQAIDPLSAVKAAKRGEVLLMRRLGEVGVSLPSTTSADQAVKKFFQDPPPHQLDALSDMFPMLKNKSKTSPFMGLSVD